jgi:hypothetical protein
MLTSGAAFISSTIIYFLRVIAIYMAAFTYNYGWTGIITIMVITYLTANFLYGLLTLKSAKKSKDDTKNSAIIALAISALASLTIFIILIKRFSFLQALGISFVSSIISSIIKMIVTKL